jgi:HEAT repeat protein
MLQARDAAPKIAKLLESPDLATREAVLRTLGALGNREVTPALLAALDQESEPALREGAIRALGELGDPKALPVLTLMLYDEPEGVTYFGAARLALLSMGPPAEAALRVILARKDPRVEALRLKGQPLPPGWIEAKASSVLAAMRTTAAASDVALALEKYQKALKRDAQNVVLHSAVVELVYALGALGSPGNHPLLETLVNDASIDVRMAATEALTTAGVRRSAPALLKSAAEGPAQARVAAIVAASRVGGGELLAAFDEVPKGASGDLAELLRQVVQEERVRLEAAGRCRAEAACWVKELVSQNPRVRERAAFELGWLGSKDAVTALVAALADESAEVKMAAVLSLGRLPGVDTSRLEGVLEAWEGKVAYSAPSAELRTLLARQKGRARRA